MHKAPKKAFRLRLLIYPAFQLKLIFVNVALMAAAMGFVALQLKRSFLGLSQMGVNAKIPEGHAYFRFLDWQLSQMYSYFLIAFIVGVVLSMVVTLVLSNRVAGPVVRLRGYFKRMLKTGMLAEKVRFRKGDYFADLPDAINGALRKICDDSKRDKKAA